VIVAAAIPRNLAHQTRQRACNATPGYIEEGGMSRMQAVVAFLIVGLSAPMAAQQRAASDGADIQRLRDNAYLVERDLATLSQRDTARAEPFQARLQDLQDEIIYLKVKQRKEGSVQRREYADVRDRLDDLRADMQTSLSPRPAPQRAAVVPSVIEVPVGTEMDVRMIDSLDSGKAMVEDRFETTTVADVLVGGRVAIPAGSVVRGIVTAVSPGTHTNRKARMTVSFDQVTVNGEAHPIRGTVTEAIEGGIKGDVARTGAGAGAGAVIGALLGGGKGAILGAAIGGGGTLAATQGSEVRVPQGTVLRVRLDSPVQMNAAR
jgi:TolA-binding protein